MHHKPFRGKVPSGSTGGAYSGPQTYSWVKGWPWEGRKGRGWIVGRNDEGNGGMSRVDSERLDAGRIEVRKVRRGRWGRERVGEGKLGRES